jgi:hypothetical protein
MRIVNERTQKPIGRRSVQTPINRGRHDHQVVFHFIQRERSGACFLCMNFLCPVEPASDEDTQTHRRELAFISARQHKKRKRRELHVSGEALDAVSVQ